MFKWLGGIFKKGIKNKDFEEFLKNDFIIEGERYEHFCLDSKWTSAILLGKINKN